MNVSARIEPETLEAEIVHLRHLLAQAGTDANELLTKAGSEATRRDAENKLQKLILEELHHRIKNTLATVGAIVSQSLRGQSDIAIGEKAIQSRLLALGRAHELLMQAKWISTTLAHIVREAVEPYDSHTQGRLIVSGPDITVDAKAVVAIALMLNELGTNATKFGALSVPAGSVEISWIVTDRLQLHWIERNGPLVTSPTRRSLGTRLIETLGRQMKGTAEMNYRPEGFKFLLDVPLSEITT